MSKLCKLFFAFFAFYYISHIYICVVSSILYPLHDNALKLKLTPSLPSLPPQTFFTPLFIIVFAQYPSKYKKGSRE